VGTLAELETMSSKKKTFGELIREKRTEKKLTLRKFADRVGLSPTYVSQFEQGNFAPPPADRIRKMAEVLEANADELIAAAGRMAEEVAGLIEKRPLEMASFLRHAKGLTPQQIEQLTKMAEDMSKKPKKD
jgi:predicted transcriptional regulator